MRGESSDTRMDEPCDICGYVGFEELIVTCSKCCIAREHVYCMRVYAKEVPQVWFCEACVLNDGILLPKSGLVEEAVDSPDMIHHDVMHSGTPSRACVNSWQQAHSKKLKPVETGKVKFLSTEEVIKLSAGSQKMGSPQFGLPNTIVTRCKRTPVPSKTVTQLFSYSREKANPSVVSSRFVKSPTHGSAQINAMVNHWASKMSKESKGNTLHVAEPKNFAVEERYLQNMLTKYELYHRYLPALEATWNGGFKFFDTSTLGKFYGGFQAQPPCRVHLKAFQFAQKLPKILQVKMLPRCHLWPELFGNDFPDFCDIALYFFPAVNIERSKQNNFCLFELLENNDSLMRSYIDGLELLIFTSKQLHVDSQRVLGKTNAEYFLWGIFRHVKDDKIPHKVHEIPPSVVSTVECASGDHDDIDNIEAIDMDIDMEGGRIVGTVDVAVSKELSGSTCGISGKGDVDSATGRMLLDWKKIHNYSDSSTKFTEKIQGKIAFQHSLEGSQRKLANFKDEIDVPPSFKEISRPSSRTKNEKPGLVDGGVKNEMKVSIGFKGVSGGDFGACSPQPERYSEETHLTIPQICHQKPASNQADDPLAAYPGGLKIKAVGNDHGNLGRKGKKESEVMPFPHGHTDSLSGKGYARDKKRYHPRYLVDVKPATKMDASVGWSPPPKDWVKLNIEGSSRGNMGSAGAGGIVRNESGKWLLGYTENLGNCDSLAAELKALYQGLKLVWKRGFRKVLVESVSREAVKCLERTPAFLDPNKALIDCCRDLLKRNWQCKLKYTHKEGNLCANWLATHTEDQPLGSLAVFDSPPYKLIPIFQNDCTVVAQTHAC